MEGLKHIVSTLPKLKYTNIIYINCIDAMLLFEPNSSLKLVDYENEKHIPLLTMLLILFIYPRVLNLSFPFARRKVSKWTFPTFSNVLLWIFPHNSICEKIVEPTGSL